MSGLRHFKGGLSESLSDVSLPTFPLFRAILYKIEAFPFTYVLPILDIVCWVRPGPFLVVILFVLTLSILFGLFDALSLIHFSIFSFCSWRRFWSMLQGLELMFLLLSLFSFWSPLFLLDAWTRFGQCFPCFQFLFLTSANLEQVLHSLFVHPRPFPSHNPFFELHFNDWSAFFAWHAQNRYLWRRVLRWVSPKK